MNGDQLEARLGVLLTRLHGSYDGIGHSSGRPYVYFVYPPEREQVVRHLAVDILHDTDDLHFLHLDLLPLTVDRLRGQEERRAAALEGPMGEEAANGIVNVWTRALRRAVEEHLAACRPEGRPVVSLLGLAALHPLSNPTVFMERLAEDEMRNPVTGQALPTVLFVPGIRPPNSSRTYWFLGQSRLELTFYRGEEV